MSTRIDRRALLAMAATIPVVTACNGLPGVVTTALNVGPQLVADVQGIATKLATVFPTLSGLTNSNAWNTVSKLLPQLQSLASGLNTSLTQTAGQPIINQFVAVLTQVVEAAIPFIPPPYNLLAQGAVALIPYIQQGVGLIASALHPAAGGMLPAQARQVLSIPVLS